MFAVNKGEHVLEMINEHKTKIDELFNQQSTMAFQMVNLQIFIFVFVTNIIYV